MQQQQQQRHLYHLQQQQEFQQHLQQQRQPLTTTILTAATNEQQKQMLGERLFSRIVRSHASLAGKITGMLLEIDNSELLHLLEDGNALAFKVDEAVKVLDKYARGAGLPATLPRKADAVSESAPPPPSQSALEQGAATSTLFQTISHVVLRSTSPHTRREVVFTCCVCLLGADSCL